MQIKTILILSVVCLGLSGCVSVKYESSKGDKFVYNRFGNQKLTGLSASKKDDGSIDLQVETAESTRDKELYSLINRALSVAESSIK